MNGESQHMVAYLQMVQGIITRMAGNSAQMKTWAVSLVTAAYVFSGVSTDPHWLIGAGGCIPVVAFWAMDARYLHLERCYRRLYEAVRAQEDIQPFDLDYRPYAASVDPVWRVAWSWSVCLFYGALLAVTWTRSRTFGVAASSTVTVAGAAVPTCTPSTSASR